MTFRAPRISAHWSDPVFSFTSDRSIDFSLRSRSHPFDDAQKEFLSKEVHFSKIINIRQVHGNQVVLVDARNRDRMDVVEEADALITKEVDVALAIRTADCLPIFIYDPGCKGIGLVHAGWQGARQEVVKKTIEMMQRQWGGSGQRLKIVFGPAIRLCCYEVGKEFLQRFPKTAQKKGEKYFFDLIQENRNQLKDMGVVEENIRDDLVCTCCEDKYFSYRREGQQAGRMISMMMMKNEESG